MLIKINDPHIEFIFTDLIWPIELRGGQLGTVQYKTIDDFNIEISFSPGRPPTLLTVLHHSKHRA